MKIELVDAIPELENQYKAHVESFILAGKITLEEWNARFKNFRDVYVYSIIHYFESVVNCSDVFVTLNPIMLENREELEKRFGVEIKTPGELLEDKTPPQKERKR